MDDKPISVRVTPDLRAVIAELCAENGITESVAVRLLLSRAIGEVGALKVVAREGLKLGSFTFIRALTPLHRWIVRECEAANWQPDAVASIPVKLSNMLGVDLE